ncbi:hypothetical protein N431DRAFT_394302 [Stipitochalara longipes BDJ]|nr:hypothetical protein N431DRAFT_394302 [Stipitochalara longipes BDJ]
MNFFMFGAFVAGFLVVASGYGKEQQIFNEGAQEMTIEASLGNVFTSFEWDKTTSAQVEVVWKNDKSTSSGWTSHTFSRNGTLLDFDDIKTPTFLTNITTNKNMTFSSFKVLNVPLALKAGLLDTEDANAATSLPNALLGSRAFSSPSHITIPRIYVSNNCSSPKVNCKNDFPYRFEAVSMSIKPLGYIEKGESVHMDINGWQFEGEEVAKWYEFSIIFFGPGRVGRGRLGLEQWGEGKGINVLETKFTGGDGSDWLFAVDDLVVDFMDEEDEREGKQNK